MEAASPRKNNARLWIFAETGLLCALGLIAIFWLIPAETTGGGIGLTPAALPIVCVAAAMSLVVLDAFVRLLGWIAPSETPLHAAPALRVIALCVIGAGLLRFMNPALCTALLLPPLMLLLGERRIVRIVTTTAITAAILAAALAWRG